MILSSRCGRGRLLRISNNFSRLRASKLSNFVFALFEMLRRLGNRVPLDQDILAAKFIVRIAAFRRVAVRLHAVVKLEDPGVAPSALSISFSVQT